jgi:hypothetical protein
MSLGANAGVGSSVGGNNAPIKAKPASKPQPSHPAEHALSETILVMLKDYVEFFEATSKDGLKIIQKTWCFTCLGWFQGCWGGKCVLEKTVPMDRL